MNKIKIGEIFFDENGYSNSSEFANIVMRDGKYIKSKEDGNWLYKFYSYGNRIVGIQWESGIYYGIWLLFGDINGNKI